MENREFTKEEIETGDGLCKAVARILAKHGHIYFVEEGDLKKRVTENAFYVEAVRQDGVYKPLVVAKKVYRENDDEIKDIQEELKGMAAQLGANCFFTRTASTATDYLAYSKVLATPYIIVGRDEMKLLEKVYPNGLPYELYREIGDRYDSDMVKLDVVDLYGKEDYVQKFMEAFPSNWDENKEDIRALMKRIFILKERDERLDNWLVEEYSDIAREFIDLSEMYENDPYKFKLLFQSFGAPEENREEIVALIKKISKLEKRNEELDMWLTEYCPEIVKSVLSNEVCEAGKRGV